MFFYIPLLYYGGGNGCPDSYQEKKCNLAGCMQSFSVVIICKDEADVIGNTLQSLQGITDDIVLYDNGSTDATIEIAKQFNVNLHQGSWEGFGKTKMKAIALAKYDWILSLDADEAIDKELRQSLPGLQLSDKTTVYEIRFKNFLGNKQMKYGEWGGDKHIRLFNRNTVHWNDVPVHEQLIMPGGVVVKKLKGYVLHQTMKDVEDYRTKTVKYAMLSAEKYYRQGKKSSWFKLHIVPGFTFFNYYILKLGFLDGYEGYTCARMTAWYTFLKYARLKELKDKSE
ncbi:MAG TPA: glycosyltransferase family 2 protein [Chitinophagaceae bacterium]|nr:glycosyltransferase family 2 protein [Chitinophagaceae bacterium]